MQSKFLAPVTSALLCLGLAFAASSCEVEEEGLVELDEDAELFERNGRKDCPHGRDVQYISRSPDECAAIRFFCEEGAQAFINECGCGCIPEAEPIACGGIAGKKCPKKLTCIDDPTDACDPDCGGADCTGICVDVEGSFCGGIAGFVCAAGEQCFDSKGDGCSASCGGADCGGFCATIP